ncbi:DUF4235 domain-containing protein [Streptomyces huasconensis]|uniref:DUF4235 domain-containing protein n=1 Tax=Streptomyces huasconensis TaxID=1854574 RepID=UPI0033E70F6A
MTKATMLYKPLGMAFGMLGGMAASALFNRTWKMVAGEDDAPDAHDEDRAWREILAAAALQGAIFAVVKAAVQRGGAVSVRRVTGQWPD